MSDEKEQGAGVLRSCATCEFCGAGEPPCIVCEEGYTEWVERTSQPESERIESLHKWPLCVHGKRVVDCVPCHIMVRNAIRPWRQKCSTLEAELAEARKDIERSNKPWSVKLVYCGGRKTPFESEEMDVVDVGESDRILSVESKVLQSLQAKNTDLERRLEVAMELLKCARPIWRDDCKHYTDWELKQEQFLAATEKEAK